MSDRPTDAQELTNTMLRVLDRLDAVYVDVVNLADTIRSLSRIHPELTRDTHEAASKVLIAAYDAQRAADDLRPALDDLRPALDPEVLP